MTNNLDRVAGALCRLEIPFKALPKQGYLVTSFITEEYHNAVGGKSVLLVMMGEEEEGEGIGILLPDVYVIPFGHPRQEKLVDFLENELSGADGALYYSGVASPSGEEVKVKVSAASDSLTTPFTDAELLDRLTLAIAYLDQNHRMVSAAIDERIPYLNELDLDEVSEEGIYLD